MKKSILYFLILLFSTIACQRNEVIKTHGIAYLEKREKLLIVNKSNKNDVIKVLGQPATKGLKNDNLSISLGKYSIYVPMKTYGMVECIHQILLHLILDESMNIYEWDRYDCQNMNSKNFKL